MAHYYNFSDPPPPPLMYEVYLQRKSTNKFNFVNDLRGAGSGLRFDMDDILPNDILSSLTNNDFKTDLCSAYADDDMLSACDNCVDKGECVVYKRMFFLSKVWSRALSRNQVL